jgi:hypothetical protein
VGWPLLLVSNKYFVLFLFYFKLFRIFGSTSALYASTVIIFNSYDTTTKVIPKP